MDIGTVVLLVSYCAALLSLIVVQAWFDVHIAKEMRNLKFLVTCNVGDKISTLEKISNSLQKEEDSE